MRPFAAALVAIAALGAILAGVLASNSYPHVYGWLIAGGILALCAAGSIASDCDCQDADL